MVITDSQVYSYCTVFRLIYAPGLSVANYSLASSRNLAESLISLTFNCSHLALMALRLAAETVWAISAKYLRFCINSIPVSTSSGLATRNFLNPFGNTFLVFLLVPYPIFG